MWKLEYKAAAPKSKWSQLSVAHTERHCSSQMFGWMILLAGAWRSRDIGELAMMNELIEALRNRQSAVDAPAVLDSCEMAGVEVIRDGENLRVSGALTDEIRNDLMRCKPHLLKLLANVPPWSDHEWRLAMQRVKDAHEIVKHFLNPDVDDVFSIAGRNVLADALAGLARAKKIKRIDLYRSRADWICGWMATLDERVNELREKDWSINGRPPHLIRFVGKPTKAMQRRIERDEHARKLISEKRFAEAAKVEQDS